jgi:hypothetical protein
MVYTQSAPKESSSMAMTMIRLNKYFGILFFLSIKK